jgi:uncharacterized phage-associated protein
LAIASSRALKFLTQYQRVEVANAKVGLYGLASKTALAGRDDRVTASAPYDARAIANFLLEAVENNGRTLTQLSLYRILYFCHGWHLSINNGALVKQEFEPWEHRPVVKVLRDEFRVFGDKPITKRARRLDIFTGIRAEVLPDLAPHDARFVHSVLDSYGQYPCVETSRHDA